MPDAQVVPMMPTPRKPRTGSEELGITLDLPFGGWNQELVNPNEIAVPDLLPRLEQMQRNDGHMRALYRLLSLPFRRATWDLTPADGGDEEADFVRQVFTRPPYEGGMTTSFDYVRACASKAMVTGFSVFEKVWDVQEVPGHGQCTVLRKLAPRSAKTIRFRADENGGFDGVVQRAYAPKEGYKQVLIPKEKVLFWTVDKEEHPFYGRSMFEPSLYHYDKKHKLYYIAHIAAQISAVPGRLAYEDDSELSPDQRTALRQALADFGFNTAMIVPRGIRVEPFGNMASIGNEILALINHHNIQASQSVLGQFLDLAQGENPRGSYALSTSSSDMFLGCLETLLCSFAEHLSWYVIPQLIDLNFGSKKYPSFYFDPLADDMASAMMTLFQTMSTASALQTTPDFIFKLEELISEKLGIEIDYEELEEEREAAEQEAQGVLDAVSRLMGPGIGPEEMPPDAGGGGSPPPPGGKPKPSAPGLVAAAEDALVVELAINRDRLGKFARINELGQGAGFAGKGQSQYGPIVKDIQQRLGKMGYDLGEAGDDGLYGPVTAAAVQQFQSDNGLPATGRMDLGTYALLLDGATTAKTAPATPADGTRPTPLGNTTQKRPAKKSSKKESALPARGARDLAEAASRLRGKSKPASEE